MGRKIAMIFNQTGLKNGSQAIDDLAYWAAQTPAERLAAVTFLVNQNLKPFQRMDKSAVSKKLMKP
jgi:hypothetical protein